MEQTSRDVAILCGIQVMKGLMPPGYEALELDDDAELPDGPQLMRDVKAKWVLHDLYAIGVETGYGAALPIKAVVHLAGDLGMSEVAIRTAADRRAKEGRLSVTRRGRASIYELTQRARESLDYANQRMFGGHSPEWDGHWCVVALSVPEERRHVRDRMRTQLSWLGFGSASNGLYISPHNHVDEVLRLGEELGATEFLQVHRSTVAWPTDPREVVRRSWENLGDVEDRYHWFVDRFSRVMEQTRRHCAEGTLSDLAAFRIQFVMQSEMRKCLFDDPDLPYSLLPANWSGKAARALFAELHGLVEAQARDHFVAACDAVTARIPSSA